MTWILTKVAAVTAQEGVTQVIAPAGSGKTHVLVARVRELISRGVPQGRILCTTFNKDAQLELQARLMQLGVGNVEVRTFHSIGYHILSTEKLLRADVRTITYAQWRYLSSVARNEEEGRIWIDLSMSVRNGSNLYATRVPGSIGWAGGWMRGPACVQESLCFPGLLKDRVHNSLADTESIFAQKLDIWADLGKHAKLFGFEENAQRANLGH